MVTSGMEQPSSSSVGSRRFDNTEFNSKEWALKARISRENTSSRRYSASYIRSFREEAKSFRSSITISSTASSPGYAIREEIDPSTYSFTNALKALQAKTIYSWEYMSPDGLALNSKWSEAERYICNPLSGEVPLECLSAKSLTGNSFRKITRRITMSAPLIYPPYPRHIHQIKPPFTTLEDQVKTAIQEISENRIDRMSRDVGIQSTPVDISSNSPPTPVTTPSIEERSIKRHQEETTGDSPISSAKQNLELEVEMKETSEEEDSKRNEGDKKKSKQQICRCTQAGCLPWRTLWTKTRHRLIHKSRTNTIVLCHR